MNFEEILVVIRSRKNPVIFDKRNRFIFFPNNKVAQVSIARGALRDRSIIRKDDEKSWHKQMSRMNQKIFDRSFTFTVVRNPYDRAVSAFKYLQSKGEIVQEMNFTGFCYDILRLKGISFDPHFDIQSDGLFCKGVLIPKFVARFENLLQDWHTISRAIRVSDELPHNNKSDRKKNYVDYYDDYSKNLIKSLYEEDLKNFDYEF